MFSIDKSVLVIIDVQGQLASLMYDKDRLFKNLRSLIHAARILSIPIIYTEQAPDKIGATVPEIKELLPNDQPVTKLTFSCCAEEKFMRALKLLYRKQVIVAGIESHVCVCQTVSDLLDKSYQVQIVADAVSSRTLENKNFGLHRMESQGAVITCGEMLITELIRSARHEKFKDVLKLIR